jgi:NO-binding membrane sensor protein with MHYT domain
MHVDNFTYGYLTPTLAYALSVLGSWLGLLCTVRARAVGNQARRGRWLVLAAWAMGGTGIWVMRVMALLGFSVPGLPIRYDVTIMMLSWAIAVVVVGGGLFAVGGGRPGAVRIGAAGLFTGVGLMAAHYTGMAAVRLPATLSYDPVRVAGSVVAAIAMATLMLWLTVTLRSGNAVALASLVLGGAVCAVHYTAMSAIREVTPAPRPVHGLIPITFVGPIVVFVVAVLVALMVALLDRSGADGSHDGEPTLALVPAVFPISAGVIPSRRTSPLIFRRSRD